jgi:hypothetical protein
MTLKAYPTILTPENKKVVYADRARSRRKRIQKARQVKNSVVKYEEYAVEDFFWEESDEDAARCHVCGCSPCSLDTMDSMSLDELADNFLTEYSF